MKSPALQKKVSSEVLPTTRQLKKAATPEVVMTDMIETLIRERAYQLYVERGYRDGHAESDWYAAETEILERLNTAAA